MPETTSLSTLQGALAGDRGALDRLMTPICEYVLQVALKLAPRDYHAAEDMAQEAAAIVAKKIADKTFDHDRARLRTYSYGVVQHLSWKHFERVLSRRGVSLSEAHDAGSTVSEASRAAANREELNRAAWMTAALLVAIREVRREANQSESSMRHFQQFQLHVLSGEKSEAVGARLGVKPATVRTNAARMRGQVLRRALRILEPVGISVEEDRDSLAAVFRSAFRLTPDQARWLLRLCEHRGSEAEGEGREETEELLEETYRSAWTLLMDPLYGRASEACRSSCVE